GVISGHSLRSQFAKVVHLLCECRAHVSMIRRSGVGAAGIIRGMFIRQFQEMFYRRAKTPKDLPWHRDAPDGFLPEVVEARAKPGRALDLGCGSGVFSVWLAKQGYQVT